MGVFRRVVLPVAWLLVFAVIALALVKIAFIDGLRAEESGPAPMAQVGTPAVPAVRATVTNTVQLKATVQSDPAQPVRSTAAGTVVHIYREAGTTVAKGEAVIQVRTEQPREPAQAPAPGEEPAEGQSSEPVYVYTDVPAPAGGKVSELGVLIDQQVTVGETVGKVDPGSYTVSGPVTAAQQFRLLGKPGSAEVALTGGPAPFTCPAVTLKTNASDAGASGGGTGGGTGAAGLAVPAGGLQPAAVAIPGGGGEAPQDGGPATGTLSCAIPSGTEVFAGLGATMTVTAGESKNVITVPLSSVKGSVKEGIVWLAGKSATGPAAGAAPGAAAGAPAQEDPGQEAQEVPVQEVREPEQRRVKLGLNDGSKVEVTSGLAEGEMVLEFVPGAAAPPAMPGPGQMVYGPAGG